MLSQNNNLNNVTRRAVAQSKVSRYSGIMITQVNGIISVWKLHAIHNREIEVFGQKWKIIEIWFLVLARSLHSLHRHYVFHLCSYKKRRRDIVIEYNSKICSEYQKEKIMLVDEIPTSKRLLRFLTYVFSSCHVDVTVPSSLFSLSTEALRRRTRYNPVRWLKRWCEAGLGLQRTW